MTQRWICVLFVLFIVCSAANSQNIRDVKFNDVIWGRKLMPLEMSDHVIVMMVWAADSNKCRTFATELNSFYQRYKQDGLIVVAIHDAQVPREMAWKYAKDNKLAYPIYTGSVSKAIEIKQVPHIIIFNPAGGVVYSDKSEGSLKKAQEFLRNSPYWLLGKSEFKFLGSEAKSIISACKDGQGLGIMYKRLTEKRDKSKNEGEQEEAKYLLDRLEKYILQQKAMLPELIKNDPIAYLDECKKFAKQFKGLEMASETISEYSKLLKDSNFKRLVDAESIWLQLVELQYLLKPLKSGESIESSLATDPLKFGLKNMAVLSKMKDYAAVLQKKYADTVFAQKAIEMLQHFMGSTTGQNIIKKKE